MSFLEKKTNDALKLKELQILSYEKKLELLETEAKQQNDVKKRLDIMMKRERFYEKMNIEKTKIMAKEIKIPMLKITAEFFFRKEAPKS